MQWSNELVTRNEIHHRKYSYIDIHGKSFNFDIQVNALHYVSYSKQCPVKIKQLTFEGIKQEET